MRTSQLERPPRTAPDDHRSPGAHPLRPTELEVATGSIWGGRSARLPDVDGTPLLELEKAVLPALERPPCLVTFSGGRDSSAVLAVASRVARREGLELPIPITHRFRESPLTEESEWQELVIKHLALTEWEVRELGDEADVVGPLSTMVLRRHGMLYPPNRFWHLPLLEAARGGSLLTGLGGDHVFAIWRWQVMADLLARRRRIESRDVRRLVHFASPQLPRRVRERRQYRQGAPSWLREEARHQAASLTARDRLAEPKHWKERVEWEAGRRELAAACWSFAVLATEVDTLLIHPLIESRFLAAVARVGGRHGLGDRTAAMRALFADLLPEQVIARPTKARFDEVFWRTHFRAFAESWTGEGVNGDIVDPGVLREEWLSPSPDVRSTMLIQSAWLARPGRNGV
jgi:hypothetical protein